MTAPDFIWAEAPDIFDGMSIWHDNGMGPGTPYVRRDPAVLAKLPEVQALLREERNKALREAAKIAEARHEVWQAGDGFHDGEGFPAVSCDVTACQNIAAAIRALIPEAPHE